MSKKRLALVTGGVGGIGTAVCKALAEDGHFVVANFAIPGSEARWQAAMDQAGLCDSTALAFGDVAGYESAGTMIRAIEGEHGPIDVVINCAGITRDASFRKMTVEQWDEVIRVNLYSVFNVTRHVIEGMCQRGFGRIVSISSVNAVRGQFGQTNYAASKAAILGFTKSLAQEVIRKGVTVNAISPGYIDTDMTRAIREDIREEIVAAIPAGRMGTPDDIAHAIRFLVSDAASYVTGTNLSVNGGAHMYQ
jgi:acetoacetyl-CoA reductase